MAFKMKRTPIKGRLDNFFSSLGKKATSDRQAKQIQENQGMTNFEKKMADKAAQRKSGGKSKFQKAAAERKANKAATAAGDARNAADNKARLDADAYKSEKSKTTVPENKAKLTFKQAFAAARKAGKKEFTWKGNPYTTKLAKSNSKQDVSKPKGRRTS